MVSEVVMSEMHLAGSCSELGAQAEKETGREVVSLGEAVVTAQWGGCYHCRCFIGFKLGKTPAETRLRRRHIHPDSSSTVHAVQMDSSSCATQ